MVQTASAITMATASLRTILALSLKGGEYACRKVRRADSIMAPAPAPTGRDHLHMDGKEGGTAR
jgi:hypothetical protein